MRVINQLLAFFHLTVHILFLFHKAFPPIAETAIQNYYKQVNNRTLFPQNAISATQIHKTTRQNRQEKFCRFCSCFKGLPYSPMMRRWAFG